MTSRRREAGVVACLRTVRHDRDQWPGPGPSRAQPRDVRVSVGSYADVGHSAREAMGSYAGDADGQRRGGVGDIDRDTVTTYAGDVRRVRIASHRNLRKLLVGAGLDEATAAVDVDALHRGRVLVLVQSAQALDEIAAVMDA